MTGGDARNRIECENLAFSYDRRNRVLEDVTFSVQRGTYLGLIGPNGGGKTTLVRILLGLLAPQRGSIRIFGESAEENRRHGHTGYVPQRIAQTAGGFPATVEEIVRSGRVARVGALRRFRVEDREAVERAMETVGVARFRRRHVGRLSGGERQKVFIARALAAEPEVLILDEPTANIDIASEHRVYEVLRQLNREQGMTIIAASHDIDVVVREVGMVLCVNRELVCHASPEDLVSSGDLARLYGEHVAFIGHRHT